LSNNAKEQQTMMAIISFDRKVYFFVDNFIADQNSY